MDEINNNYYEIQLKGIIGDKTIIRTYIEMETNDFDLVRDRSLEKMLNIWPNIIGQNTYRLFISHNNIKKIYEVNFKIIVGSVRNY